ncbi:unnamed protein product [Vicia faba]|uniref:IBB domain-containing protein n=1 Tax=Vicia faba TaxID=3906 RepID=A0AAV1B3W2_VICFA|nr:unnamed protein product [Vicia faba]
MSRITLIPDTYPILCEKRKKEYKGIGVVESEDGRRRRNEDLFMIRKNSRQDSQYKRRKHPREDASAPLIETLPFTIYIPVRLYPSYLMFRFFGVGGGLQEQELLDSQLQAFPTMKEALLSDDPNAQLEGSAQCGKLLSKGYIPHIDKVIRAGIVPQLVTFLTRNEMPQLQSMAAWTLANIASGLSEHTRTVIEYGAVPLLVQLLSSSSEDIKEQAMWALSNIAGDSPCARDDVFNHGALSPLLSILWSPNCITKSSTLKIAMWTFSNLCVGKPLPMLLEQIPPALPALRELLMMPDEESILHGCQTLYCLTQKESIELNQAIIDANICPRLLELLLNPKSKVLVSTLRTIGNISTGNEVHTKHLIDSGGLPVFNFLLTQSDKFILREVCWIISNIAGGPRDHVQAIIDADLISSIVHLTKAEPDIRQPAAWGIVNATCNATHEQIRLLSCLGCIEALCDLLTITDPNLLVECLDGLINILIVGKVNKEKGLYNGVNIYGGMIEECGGLDKIASLQSFDNDQIYDRAVDILVQYFNENLELDEENLHNNNSVDETIKEDLEVDEKILHTSVDETIKEDLEVDEKILHTSVDETIKEDLEVDEKILHTSVDETMKEDLEVDEKILHTSVDETMKEDLEVDEKILHTSVDETIKEDLQVDEKILHTSVDETIKEDLQVDEKILHTSVDETIKEDIQVDDKDLLNNVVETMKENLQVDVVETMKEDLQVDDQDLLHDGFNLFC